MLGRKLTLLLVSMLMSVFIVQRVEIVKSETNIHLATYYITGWGTFPGQRSSDWSLGTPLHPLIGEYRSNDPVVASQHINWAIDYGIEIFVIPYTDGRLAQLKTGWEYNLEIGLMKADNFNLIRFCIMFNNEPYWSNPSELPDLTYRTNILCHYKILYQAKLFKDRQQARGGALSCMDIFAQIWPRGTCQTCK